MPGGVAKTFIPTREPVMKDVFDEWLARIICYDFSVPPSAFTSQVNRATAETVQETSLAEGLAPLQNWVKQLVDAVIAREFQAPDLEFAWDQDKAVDPSEVAHIAASYVAAGIKSVNEVRAELGLAPVPGGELPQAAAAQGRGRNGPAADDAALANADTLFRSNPNHYGPGERGGQFAPADEGGSGGASSAIPVVYRPGDRHSESDAGPLIPAQEPVTSPLGGRLPGWFAGERPSVPPIKGPIPTAPEPPSTPSPKVPSPPAERSAAPSEPRSPPSKEAPPDIGHNSPPSDEPTPEASPKPQPPDQPYTLPPPVSRSDSYKAGTDVATRLKEAIKNGWDDVARQIAEVADAAHRVANQIPNIVADVDFSLGAPYDLQSLIDNAKGPSQAGYQDHHIVPAQRGTEDKGLTPDDEKRLEDPENFVRIPNYVHQRITNYYNTPDPDPPCNGQKPIDYLRDKNFDERYRFGLKVLRDRGVIK